MKPSKELFRLVKSLSKSEKRFFKLSSSLQSGEKNYLKIFDYIEAQDEYDEEALKEEFKGETFIKHLPSEKNHLYKLILKSLRSFHADNNISAILKQEIKNIDLLYKKALYKECEKFLKRAKKLAEEHEKFYYHFELISWEKRLLEEAYEAGKFDKDLEKLVEEETLVIEKLRNLAEYQVLYSRINALFRSGGFSKNDREREIVAEIANNHLIKGKNTAISERASSICYYIKGLCAATNREFEESFVNFKKVRLILDRNPKIRMDLPKRYLLTLSHLRECYMDSKNFEQAEDIIQDIKGLEGDKGFNSIDISLGIITQSYFGELYLYNTIGQFGKSVALLPKIHQKLEPLKDKVTKEKKLIFTYYQAYAYFGQGSFKQSLNFLNEILNDNEQKLRQDIFMFSRIFNLVLHYDLKNYEFLDYNVKSTQRYLKKVEKDSVIEEIIVNYIKKLARKGDSPERKEIFEEMKMDIEALLAKSDNRAILNYFNIQAWIDAKVNGIGFSEAVKNAVY